MQQFEECSVHRLARFNCQEMENAVWAFAKLHHAPSSQWMSRFERVALAQLERCKPQNLANLLYAFVQLGHNPSARWYRAWLSCARQQLGAFKARELAMCLTAVAALHQEAAGVRFGKAPASPTSSSHPATDDAPLSEADHQDSRRAANANVLWNPTAVRDTIAKPLLPLESEELFAPSEQWMQVAEASS